jgi:hypothetical protein
MSSASYVGVPYSCIAAVVARPARHTRAHSSPTTAMRSSRLSSRVHTGLGLPGSPKPASADTRISAHVVEPRYIGDIEREPACHARVCVLANLRLAGTQNAVGGMPAAAGVLPRAQPLSEGRLSLNGSHRGRRTPSQVADGRTLASGALCVGAAPAPNALPGSCVIPAPLCCQERGFGVLECAPALVAVNVVRPVGRSTLTARARGREGRGTEAAWGFASALVPGSVDAAGPGSG